jgi:hypothetical protein
MSREREKARRRAEYRPTSRLLLDGMEEEWHISYRSFIDRPKS